MVRQILFHIKLAFVQFLVVLTLPLLITMQMLIQMMDPVVMFQDVRMLLRLITIQMLVMMTAHVYILYHPSSDA